MCEWERNLQQMGLFCNKQTCEVMHRAEVKCKRATVVKTDDVQTQQEL